MAEIPIFVCWALDAVCFGEKFFPESFGLWEGGATLGGHFRYTTLAYITIHQMNSVTTMGRIY